jgi:predicted permease
MPLLPAARLLWRSPLFTLTSVLSLTLGVGASAAIFSLADALLLAPTTGVANPAAVVDIGRSNGGSGFDNMSHPSFTYLRAHTQSLAGIAAVDFAGGPMSLTQGGSSERVVGTLVSANYFDVLGTRPAIGRFFLADEDRVPGERPVVVLSHSLWTRRFDADPKILETPIRLNNHDFTVVGVAEPGFEGSSFVGTDLWAPIAMVAVVRGRANADLLTDVEGVWHVAIGRLRTGVSLEQAEAELNTLLAAYKASEPRANPQHEVALEPMGRIPGPVRVPFLGFIGFLFALTAALVAIACSNVAGMLLARAAGRRREMATRLAVGAGRRRLMAQLLTETFVLFAAAGILAVPVTWWLLTALESFLPALPLTVNLDLRVNGRVLAYILGLSTIAGGLSGLAPARHALGGDLAPLLHGANATADRTRFRLRHALVAAQVALSLMLVVTAFLFVRTLAAAADTDPGYDVTNVQIVSVDVGLSGFRDQQAVALATRYRERLAAISGVESIAYARMIPLQGSGFGLGPLRVPGVPGPGRDGLWRADWDVVSSDYFRTVGLRLLAGRAFADADRDGAPLVAVINETFATRAWPGEPAVGRQIEQAIGGDEFRPIEVIGVIEDAKYRYISDAPRPFVYVPAAQQPTPQLEFYLRHAAGQSIGADVRAAFAQVEPSVPIIMMQSFEDAAALGLVPQRLAAWLAGVVGALGIFLAALGLYGLMAFVVAQRTREIAIRMALGATRRTVRSMVLQQAGWLAAAGAMIGLVLAAAVGTLAQSLLFGVPAIDPVSFGGTALLFALVLGLACWPPASRAAATDPADALRAE